MWTPTRTALVKAAAEDPEIARIFVNAAIKKAMCSEAGSDRAWLAKVRPWWGHAEHFHVRLDCPPDSPQCKSQPPVPAGDGCGHALDYWFKPGVLHPKPPKMPPGREPRRRCRLPAACKQVVQAPYVERIRKRCAPPNKVYCATVIAMNVSATGAQPTISAAKP